MKRCFYGLILFIIGFSVPGRAKITEVDLLQQAGLDANALGPQVIMFDATHQRLVAACVNSSSLSLIETGTHRITNIPLPVRMPRRLHFQSVVIDSTTGQIFLAAEKKLVTVDPDSRTSQTVDLPGDFTSLAVDSQTGRVFLVGHDSGDVLVVDPKTQKVKTVNWTRPLAPPVWRVATPPPPIRKILIDAKLREAYLIDGATRRLVVVDLDNLTICRQREIRVEDGCPRWHLAGADWENHWIYLALEAENRAARQVVRLNVLQNTDEIIDLPQMSREPQGVCASIKRQEVYIPLDNHPYLLVAHFKSSTADSIDVPRFGMDAAVVDDLRDQLWVTNWAQGTLYRIDLKTQKLNYIVPHFPVFPHMNHLAFDTVAGDLFVPTGAAAVNGTFGASLTVFNTFRNEFKHLPLGWGPVSLARQPQSDAVYVFGSDQEFAQIQPDGKPTFYKLPQSYAVQAVNSPDGKDVFVAYGPHSSSWPEPYIASTRHGIFRLGQNPIEITDLRTDRLAQKITFDRQGKLWALQNTWGFENPFVMIFAPDQPWQRLFLPDKMENEANFRLLVSDPERDQMYLVRVGDQAQQPGVLYIACTHPPEILATIALGLTPTDLCIQPASNQILISNFDSDSVTVIHRNDFSVSHRVTGSRPLSVGANPRTGETFAVNHLSRTISVWGATDRTIQLPGDAFPNNLRVDVPNNRLLVTAHAPDHFVLFEIIPGTGKVKTIFKSKFPYGEITFDQANSAFGERAQWADAIFRLTDFLKDARGRWWISDYLSGKVWIWED